MIIDIDIGNTRAKYRVFRDNPATEDAPTQVCANVDLAAVLQTIPLQDVTWVRIASVAAREIADAIKRELELRSAATIKLVVSTAQCAGVTNSYAEPHRLGVDRWLAVLAAYNRWRSCCIVIDAGTALKIDVVNADGQHEGGWIVPGLDMLRSSLIAGTAGVRFEADSSQSLALGRSTATAVQNGTLSMAAAWLNSMVPALLAQYCGARIVLCGGDADRLRSYLSFDALDWPDIVLDGLALIPLGD